MKKKVFSLMMTLLLAFIGVAKADVVTIGDGTGTTYYGPFNSLWGYSFVEQVYTADEVGTAGTINAISFNLSSGSQTNAIDVYMKNVSRTSFSDNTDWEPVTASDIVFSGTVTFNAGWTTITLDTPFQYDGTSNLMIGMHEYTSGYSTLYFTYTAVTGGLISGHSDSYDPNPTNMGSYSGSMYVQNYRNNIQIDITPGGGAGGGEPATLLVHDGTATNSYVPVYGFYADAYLKCEMVYPAAELSDMNGGTINAITFYTTSPASEDWTSTWQVFVNEVADASINSFYGPGTVVYEGALNGTGAEMTINFTTPYQYNGGNLLVGVYNTTTGTYSSCSWYGETVDGASVQGYSYSSLASVSPTQRNFLPKTQFNYTTASGDESDYEEGLHTLATYGVGSDAEELIDLLYIERPNGAWMEPYHFQLYNDGEEDVEVVLIDFLHNNGYFSMDEETTEYPFTVEATGLPGVDLYINTNIDWESTEVINSLLAVNTTERSTHLYPIIAAPYQPYCPDVYELAYPITNITAGEPWSMWTSEMWAEHNPNVPYDLHDNYTLPFPEIPEGYDAVMSFTLDHDMVLNAYVSDGACDSLSELNGKVALYRADFDGEAGPMADNYYDGRPFTNVPAGDGGSGEITVHDGTATNGYVPVYGFYTDAYLKCEMVYTASELSGMSGRNINSMKFYSSTSNVNWGSASFQVFLTEVASNTISAYNGPGTVVYQGALSIVNGEMVVNFTTPYHYNGGNLLVGIYCTTTGSYVSCTWLGETISGASVQGYSYSDLSSVSTTQRNFLPKTTFAYSRGGNDNRATLTYNFDNSSMSGWTTIDADGDGFNWDLASNLMSNVPGHNNSADFVFSQSYSNDYGVLYPDNYLVSPQVQLGGSISFWACGQDSGYTEEHFGVAVSTTSNTNASAFTTVQEWTLPANGAKSGDTPRDFRDQGAWHQYTVDLSAYSGMGYVAIRHFNCSDMFYLDVDDITIVEGSTTPTPPTPVDPEEPVEHAYTAGPVIEGLNVLAGTYYLVASSTCDDFEVTINFEEMPCPIEAVTNIYPADNAWGIPSNDLTLLWTLNDYANEWRIVFGSTYYPEDEPNHPATYISEWSSDLQESLHITDYVQLWDNTNYFWRIEQRSNPGTEYECVTSGPVFGFTTTFDIPQNLQVNGGITANIFETEEDVTLTWNRIYDRNNRNNDRTFRRYRIYWNGELYDETTDNNVEEISYTIPNSEFHYNMVPREPEEFNVTAVYDEGESPFSNTAYVQVSGYGTISGTAYEQDGVTPIGGVTVIINGVNEFGGEEEYTFTTNAEGYYEGEVHVGVYSDAMAYMDGYQPTQTVHPLPFNIVYQQETPNVDFIIDENFYYPAHVCAQTVYVPGVEGDTLVQVWWEGWGLNGSGFIPGGSYEAQIGEGTTTSTYAPFHTLWNYSLSETLYLADELTEAGATGAPMTSLSYYVSSTTCTTPQNNISIWMANVDDSALTANSHTTADMTLVYTGNGVLPVAGQWNEFVLNGGSFSWDGHSNVLIVCQRLNGSWQGSVSWQTHDPGFVGMTYDYDDYDAYNCQTTSYPMYTSSTNRPNIIFKAGSREVEIGENRALHHFNIYRTDCYNDGPYNSENTTFLASVWRPDTSYFDVQWPQVPVGVYKYGVSAVYSGNQADNPNNPRVDYPFEERESEITWHTMCSPCIDKDMYIDGGVSVNVVLNSADSPEGVQVSFTNLNPGEEFNHPQEGVTLDQTGYYVFPRFRKGDYLVTVSMPGYYTLEVEESIWEPAALRYVLTEIICTVQNLYVSRTGWAMWDPQAPCPGGAAPVNPDEPTDPTGEGLAFDFEDGIPAGWTMIDADGDGFNWLLASDLMGTGYGNNGSDDCVVSQSYSNTYGSLTPDNYFVSPQIQLGGSISFWACAQDNAWAAEHFGVAVSTTNNTDASAFTTIQQWTMTAKGGNGKVAPGRDGGNRTQGTWYQYTVDLSAYSGMGYVAIRHFNCTDFFYLDVDDITITVPGRAVAEERHLEGFKVMCTSIDGEPIFNHNTPAEQPFCQLATDELVEGNHYIVKVAAIYSTGMSEYEQVEWQYEPCDHYVGTVNGPTIEGNTISWDYPGSGVGPTPPPTGASTFTQGFEDGLGEWTVIDGNNDGNTWCLTSAIPSTWTYYSSMTLDWYHNGSNAVCSGSYINGVGALNPNEYLVSPQVTLAAGSQLSFWVAACDASYPADHFGVFISDNGTSDWTSVQEWTLSGKSEGKAGSPASRDGRGLRLGTWYNYTVDLSAYAGQKYIAFRHFNCYDQYIMCLDDVELTAGAKGGVVYTEDDYIRMNSIAPVNTGDVNPLPVVTGNGRGNDAYACNAYGGTNPTGWITYDVDAPGAGTSLNSGLTVYGGSIAADGYVYATYNDNTWKKIEPLTGNVVASGNLGMFFVDCTYDYTTDVMYGSYSGTLYTWDLATNTTATVGAMHGSMQMIACDLNGQMYGIEYETGDFYAIDKATAACTLIGNTGQSPAYVQSGGFDHNTGKLYWAGYTSTGIFAEVNVATGAITMIGSNVGEHLSWCVPYEYNPTPEPPVSAEGILGAMIFVDGEWEAFVEYPTNSYTYEGEGEEICVRMVYDGDAELVENNYYYAMSCEECLPFVEPEPTCEAAAPIYAEVNDADDQVHIYWDEQPEPPEPEEGDTFEYDFEDGSIDGLVLIDNDGDGYNWLVNTTFGGHNASTGIIYSQSYDNNYGALTPDNYIVFPQSNIVAGSTFSFWACGQDSGWANEHFGVAVSTTGTAAADFTTVQEWTMTAKGTKAVRDGRDQGNWYQYTVDLSAYAGMPVYIALRHFNCTDMFYLDVDDVELSVASKGNRDSEIIGYNIYRSTDNIDYVLIATVDGDVTEYFDAPGEGTYYYQVTTLYEGCESAPAVSGENPEVNYVMVGVTGVGESSDNVALFPNPTKGNVTIQAMNMHRVTVVSVLGQVVYDTELEQDEYILNMSQFNTGMYMVRVYTDEGVTVKRVTVLH